jgi:hypothetical protein
MYAGQRKCSGAAPRNRRRMWPLLACVDAGTWNTARRNSDSPFRKVSAYWFVTGAAALIGVAIGYSSGLKLWLLTAVSIAVLAIGFYGYCLMVVRGRLISARVAEIEDRINKLVLAESSSSNLLTWESEHKDEAFISELRRPESPSTSTRRSRTSMRRQRRWWSSKVQQRHCPK